MKVKPQNTSGLCKCIEKYYPLLLLLLLWPCIKKSFTFSHKYGDWGESGKDHCLYTSAKHFGVDDSKLSRAASSRNQRNDKLCVGLLQWQLETLWNVSLEALSWVLLSHTGIDSNRNRSWWWFWPVCACSEWEITGNCRLKARNLSYLSNWDTWPPA